MIGFPCKTRSLTGRVCSCWSVHELGKVKACAGDSNDALGGSIDDKEAMYFKRLDVNLHICVL